MRKLITLAILAYLAYAYHNGSLTLPFFKNDNTPTISNDNPGGAISITYGNSAPALPFTSSPPNSHTNSRFRCDGRQYCSQMTSYDEALFFLQNCPNTKMDGDHDGIPCEAQFDR